MSEPISPWEYSVELSSPNGKYVARFNGNEIAMGGPSTGTLKLSNGFEMRANAAMIWSSDSKYLAVAVWTKINHQELAVVDVEKKQIVKIIPGFSVIEFHSFDGRKIIGINSPIYMPRLFEENVSDLS